MMKILVTGSNGFVGKNIVATLEQLKTFEVYRFDKEDTDATLELYAKDCDFVIHLAGVNRPEHVSEFYEGNVSVTEKLCGYLVKHNNPVPVLITSSIQAELDNDYGKSKRDGEVALLEYSKETGTPVVIYRLPNLFGKWSRPFYNSVVSTWCHLIARGESIEISNPDHVLTLVYVDDLVQDIVKHIHGQATRTESQYYEIAVSEKITLGDLAQTIQSFKESRDNLVVPNMANPLEKKLYSTYLSYLPKDDFAYPLLTHSDDRGSFTEIVKQASFGQVSVNISKPGITKGNHWHHSKNEKFLVVKGQGKIQLRDIYEDEIIEYEVSDKKLVVVDIPPGYTHNIINTSNEDMVTVMWVNESFDPENPDTFYQTV